MSSVEVSVIMATFNCEKTVSVAIDSIIGQTFSNWEFIICDDSSEDGTYQILLEYNQSYPGKFIILKNQINSKLPFSLNRCLAVARGKYIARMDADDISMPNRLEKQVNFLKNNPEYDVCGTSMIRFDENGDYDKYEAVINPDKYTLLTQVPFCHATIMMKKSVYDALNGYVVSKRTERGQDLDMWFRFFAKGFRGNNISDALYKVCEDRNAIKRRKIKYDLYMCQTRYLGFKELGFRGVQYIFVIKPLISRMIPRKLKLYMRRTGKI